MTNRQTGPVRQMARLGALATLTAVLAVTTAAAAGTPQAISPGKTPPSGKAAAAGKTPVRKPATPAAGPVTDANVAERVVSAHDAEDQRALAAYYKAKAAGEEENIVHFDQLFRAYQKLAGKQMEPLQRQARLLLRAARELKERYLLLGQAHFNLAAELYGAADVRPQFATRGSSGDAELASRELAGQRPHQ